MADTYREIHHTLFLLRGRASDYDCECGEPARDWAYQFTGETLRDANGRGPHSLNPDDYIPMCRSCHNKYDLENDPSHRGSRSMGGRKGMVTARKNMSPERLHEIAVSAGRASWADPEAAERIRAGQRRAASRRRKCLECGFESNPGGMGNHRRWSGHDNYEEIEGEQ